MRRIALGLAVLGVAAACTTVTDSRSHLLRSEESALKLRSMQSRSFDTVDVRRTLRTVMSTLQDLDFVIDEADSVLGSVSATKLDNGRLRISVTVRPHGTTQVLVRANAQFNTRPIEEPEPYQDFFAALSHAMFLDAHEVQ